MEYPKPTAEQIAAGIARRAARQVEKEAAEAAYYATHPRRSRKSQYEARLQMARGQGLSLEESGY